MSAHTHLRNKYLEIYPPTNTYLIHRTYSADYLAHARPATDFRFFSLFYLELYTVL